MFTLLGSGKDGPGKDSGAIRFVFEDDSEIEVITDFEDGVDSIEFMIESFGYDEMDVLREPEDVVLTNATGTVRLIEVNAAGLDADSFKFRTPPLNGSRFPVD